MVARTIHLPNLRKLIIPDPGYVMADADLSGADAQVVAWEADDDDLKNSFRMGLKIHAKNALDMFGPDIAGEDGTNEPIYSQIKRSIHATNYGAAARTVAISNGWPVSQAEEFQKRWFHLHPGIADWHRATEESLALTRRVDNAFGYRRIYFDRVERLLPEALAWIPQSTVALITAQAAIRLHQRCPWVQVLLQVHDSLVFQFPMEYHHAERMKEIRDALRVVVPYEDPLVIPWTIKISYDSWGDCE